MAAAEARMEVGGDYDAGRTRRHLEEKLRPNDRLIGEQFGRSKTIRKLDRRSCDPKEFFDELARYGALSEKPGLEAIGYRTVSKSGHPTIDVTIPGIGIKEIKFV